MNNKTVIPCEQCRGLLRVPADRGSIKVNCPRCQAQFIWTPAPVIKKKKCLKCGYERQEKDDRDGIVPPTECPKCGKIYDEKVEKILKELEHERIRLKEEQKESEREDEHKKIRLKEEQKQRQRERDKEATRLDAEQISQRFRQKSAAEMEEKNYRESFGQETIFKKKMTTSELGIALLQNVTCSDYSNTLNSLDDHVGKYRQRVHDELVYLLVFVVDYSVTMNLGNDSPTKDAILNVYYYHLQEMAKKGEFCADFYSTLYNERLPIYTNAVNTPHKNGVVYTVAAKFSELCVYHLDILLITVASSLFSGQFESISEIFKTWKVTS